MTEPSVQAPLARGATTSEPRRRLHPLSPLLRSARIVLIVVAAASLREYDQLGVQRVLLLLVVLLLVVGVYSAIGWWATGYQIVAKELRIYEGVLWRRTRAIPLERLQAVEVRQPVLARLTGLAELRLEVVGGAKAEAPLAFLSLAEAGALRERLLVLAGRARAPVAVDSAAPADAAVPRPTERHLHAVRNQDVFVGQLLTPQVWSVPLAIAFVGYQFLSQRAWGFIAIASTLTALAGIILQPVRRVLEDWNFRLSRDEAGLRLHHGLIETRSQVVPLDRVQGVGVIWPLLWRPKGWLRLRIDVAGYGRPSGEEGKSDRLLPVGDLATARMITHEVLPGMDLLTLPLRRPPARARWLAIWRYRILTAGLADQVFGCVDGLLTRRLTVVPYARMQSVRVVQGPIQRMFRLANVYADTAGGLTAVAWHRDIGEAWAMADELTTRARLARA